MSWDIYVQDLPPGIQSIADIPDDFQPASLGPRRSELIARLCALYPECEFSQPEWGVLDLPGCAIEIHLGEDEKVESFALFVSGDEPAPVVVAHILNELGVRALDPTSPTGLFDQDAILRSESFNRWRAYRDQVLADRSSGG